MCFGDNIGTLPVQAAVTCQPDREVAFYPPFDTCLRVLEVGCFTPSGIFLSGAFLICKARKGPSSRPLSVSPLPRMGTAGGWRPHCSPTLVQGPVQRRAAHAVGAKAEDTGSAWTRTRQ